MNEKDLATAEAIIKEANSWGFIFTHNKEDEVREMISAALTAARKEARQAAWTQVLNMARVTATSTGMPEIWALYEALKRESEKG